VVEGVLELLDGADERRRRVDLILYTYIHIYIYIYITTSGWCWWASTTGRPATKYVRNILQNQMMLRYAWHKFIMPRPLFLHHLLLPLLRFACNSQWSCYKAGRDKKRERGRKGGNDGEQDWRERVGWWIDVWLSVWVGGWVGGIIDYRFTKQAPRVDQAVFAHTVKAPAPSTSLGGGVLNSWMLHVGSGSSTAWPRIGARACVWVGCVVCM
jgi:hypothetical protein